MLNKAVAWSRRHIDDIHARTKHALMGAPIGAPRLLGSVHQLFEMRQLVRSSGLRTAPHLDHRFGLYQHLHDHVLPAGPIDYLEFGVYSGTSLRKWLALNQNPGSRFFGFDTFEGLPESWVFTNGTLEAGFFSTKGQTPDVGSDSRVKFVKGLFQDTLAPFAQTFAPQHPLVIHCDADLYSSTLYVLGTLDRFIKPGSVVIFDEFSFVNHESRAFRDYTASFRRSFTAAGWAGGFYDHVAFQAT